MGYFYGKFQVISSKSWRKGNFSINSELLVLKLFMLGLNMSLWSIIKITLPSLFKWLTPFLTDWRPPHIWLAGWHTAKPDAVELIQFCIFCRYRTIERFLDILFGQTNCCSKTRLSFLTYQVLLIQNKLEKLKMCFNQTLRSQEVKGKISYHFSTFNTVPCHLSDHLWHVFVKV